MRTQDRLNNYPIHDSIRGAFGLALYKAMAEDDRIWLLTADLGYGLLDSHKEDFPERFVNLGASECCMVGAGVGLALSGKIPFCYSITTFLLFRAFEWIRNYLNHEDIPVRLIGSGVANDYAHDGISHQPSLDELTYYFGMMQNVAIHLPDAKEEIPKIVTKMIETDKPAFLCLRR